MIQVHIRLSMTPPWLWTTISTDAINGSNLMTTIPIMILMTIIIMVDTVQNHSTIMPTIALLLPHCITIVSVVLRPSRELPGTQRRVGTLWHQLQLNIDQST